MAISKQVENNNLLNAWARVMNEKPFAFNQAAGTGAPLNNNCHVYIQQEREDIARALDSAIKMMARVLRYWPRPKWFTDTVNLGSNTIWEQIWKPPSSGKIIELGQRATTLILADAVVTYSKNPANLPTENMATMTVPAGSLTNTNEIQIFFRVADGAYEAGDERYQIEPARVQLSGGNFSITADRALFVKPSTIWDVPFKPDDPNQVERNAANTGAATDFVTAVDVYRVYNDTTTPISILDRNDTVMGSFNGKIWDAQVGLIELEDTCCQFVQGCRPAEKVQIHYRAGEALVYGQMDSELEDACIRLANVVMPEELCSFCQRTQDRFRQDRSPMVENGTATLPANNINNEFGSVVQGAVWAYNKASDRAINRTSGKLTRNWR
jgi:hypothetical protein